MSYYYTLKEQGRPFVMTIDTTLGNGNNTFIMPDIINPNFILDYGDGSVYSITSKTDPNLSHTYSVNGVYEIKIYGSLDRFSFQTNGDAEKVTLLNQWGSNRWKSFAFMFDTCVNMQGDYNDTPIMEDATNCQRMFGSCYSFDYQVDNFDMSTITNMSQMFYLNLAFNKSINFADTTAVTTMSQLLIGAENFNQPVNLVTSSSLTNLDLMLNQCDNFNQTITISDTSNVVSMNSMLRFSFSFNQDISAFNIASLTNASLMLNSASSWSTANYDAMLIGWEGQPHLAFTFGCSTQYTQGGAAEAARDQLIIDGCIITDNGGI